jgi:thymidine kinase
MEYRKARRLEIITGCMFSGKTDELLRRLERARIWLIQAKIIPAEEKYPKEILLFKPSVDTRYKEKMVVTHYGREWSAYQLVSGEETIETLEKLAGKIALEKAIVVAFDEGSFYSAKLIALCKKLVSLGKRVIVAGLDLTFAEEPFGPMPALMSRAGRVDKLTAVCQKCGSVAIRSHRISGGTGTIEVGGQGNYEALCERCYDKIVCGSA